MNKRGEASEQMPSLTTLKHNGKVLKVTVTLILTTYCATVFLRGKVYGIPSLALPMAATVCSIDGM